MRTWIIGILSATIIGIAAYTVSSQLLNSPKNLKVLRTKDITIEEAKEYMRLFTLSLGVECEFCHNVDNYSSDEKKNKLISRDMITMTYALNDGLFKDAKEEVTCYTCHRGNAKIKNSPPGL